MNISNKFLEDEVRNGFYVPSIMKQAWAAELEMLSDFDQLCKDNSITYFADFGTLLGAVRHNGFIPWDDDIDLVMKREDYNKLLQIPQSQFPANYILHTYRTKEDFNEFHAVLLNTNHPVFNLEHHSKFHGFPYSCGIDIYVLDYLFDDLSKEIPRAKDIKQILAFADGLLEGRYNKNTIDAMYSEIESKHNIHFDRNLPTKEQWVKLYDFIVTLCSSAPLSKNMALIIPDVLLSKESHYFSSEDFSESINVPFEGSTISIPKEYDSILNKLFGDYKKIVKNTTSHEYPYFKKQKESIENIADTIFSHYSYNQHVTPSKMDESNSWKSVAQECIDTLTTINNDICFSTENVINNIINAQDLALQLGELIEAVKGNSCDCISLIEKYCEELYLLYTNITEPSNIIPVTNTSNLKITFNNMINSVKDNALNKNEIVFIPFKAEYWDSMENLYNKYSADPMYDVYVLPIPYYYKNYDGSLIDEQFDITGYTDSLPLVEYNSFSLEFHQPDIIVIQNPYDQYNYSTSIHPDFYSSVLKSYTNQLIYIPWFITDDFTKDDYCDYSNMDYYVTMPGVVNADIVYLPNDCIKSLYVEKLVEWSRIKNLEFWSTKFQTKII
ncbi:MAG: LicD family protein [Lachnospiraceae bacterium]|nr:LicD family protein [Lachnospiraceae bacterium]